MYIYYSIGNNSGPQTLVCIVEVSVIGGVRFRRFHCIAFVSIAVCTLSTHILSLHCMPTHMPGEQ